MAATEVKVPDIGDFKDIPVIELLVKPGDAVKKDDSLLVLESDKATMEVPAPAAGVIAELKVKVGDKVSAGTLRRAARGGRRARGDQRKRPGEGRGARGRGAAGARARRRRRRRRRPRRPQRPPLHRAFTGDVDRCPRPREPRRAPVRA